MLHAIMIALSIILPPCQYEDVSNCYWDANVQGNGQGTSFITIQGRVWGMDGNDYNPLKG